MTDNWYWLVDGLIAEGFTVQLANPSAIQKYSCLKYADEKHDGFWLAEMVRLDILPTGYIYLNDEQTVSYFLKNASNIKTN